MAGTVMSPSRTPRAVLVPRLQAARLAAALSQDDLAEKAGVSRITIARGEHGEHIRISSVRKLARALKVRPVDLYAPARPDAT